MSWGAYAEGGFVGLAVEWVYHRWFEERQPKVKLPPQEYSLPRSDEGAPIPLIYGKCRVRQPVLAWFGVPGYGTNGFSPAVYQLNMLYALGAGFANGTNGVAGIWYSDSKKFSWLLNDNPTGNGAFEAVTLADINNLDGAYVGGYVETLNGNAAQTLVDDTDTATTYAGLNMLDYWSASSIPGHRGLISAYLHGNGLGGDADAQWRIGLSASIPAYNFEGYSYGGSGLPAVGVYARIGSDSNPINVLYDLLVDKLGIPSSYIDSTSWDAAAVTLYNESHGFSRCFDDIREASDHIIEILRQIDAVLFFDETSGTFKIRLIRDDYVPADIPQINKTNCAGLINFAAGSFYNLPNKIKLVYENAADNYLDATATARNQANAVGQDGVLIEHMIEMRGCTNADLASRLAARELAALSRPITRCRAIMDRSFVRVNPGDAVRVTMNNPDVAGIVFRVAAVDRGTLENGQIALDLIQDAAYVFRGRVPEPPGLVDRGVIRGGLVGDIG